jgi:hypothetical protein
MRVSAEAERWMALSSATVRARRAQMAPVVNAALQQATAESTLRRLWPAMMLWAAENLVHGAAFPAAIDACSQLRQRFGGTEWADDAFLVEAQAHLRLGDQSAALRSYEAAAHGDSDAARTARLEHGLLLERSGLPDGAAASFRELLTRGPAESKRSWFDRVEDIAERCLRRCTNRPTETPGCASAQEVAFQLARALREKDFEALQRLASATHFGVGVSEFSYLGFDAIADGLKDVLARSTILVDPTRLDTTGGTVGLVTSGWAEPVVINRLLFQISEEPSGWRWTGVSPSGVGFMPKLGPGDGPPPPTHHGPPLLQAPAKAPWEAGECLRAGGITRWAESFIPFYGIFLQLSDLASDCGFGAYGYYYGQGDHTNQNHYAIDFSGYVRFGPYWSKIPFLPAVAAHSGVVTATYGDTPYGIKTRNNLVELDFLTPEQIQFFLAAPGSTPDEKLHNGLPSGPGGQGGETRTRYLHLSPGLYVSRAMFIPQGTALALMDDTGYSAMPHLHFSMHVRDYILNGVPYYSVPPIFDGQLLDDSNDGTCICSTNEGPPPSGPIT